MNGCVVCGEHDIIQDNGQTLTVQFKTHDGKTWSYDTCDICFRELLGHFNGWKTICEQISK